MQIAVVTDWQQRRTNSTAQLSAVELVDKPEFLCRVRFSCANDFCPRTN
jgi:hypothetical protein